MRRRISVAIIISIGLSLFSGFGVAPSANAVAVITLTDADALTFTKSTAVTIRKGASTYPSPVVKAAAADGTTVGDIILYKNVLTSGGITVDCAVTTKAITSGSITNYDNPGSAEADGSKKWMINTVGGQATFTYEFFKGGTYTRPETGIQVVLQNVKVTSIDLDSSGTNGYQYSDFTGFQKYSMMNPTNLKVQQLSNPARVRFIAGKTGARSSVPEDQVLVKYDALQKMEINFGNAITGATNYYGLIFGAWPNGGAPVEYTNLFNEPPTASSVALAVVDTTTSAAFTVIPRSAFGDYQDVDSNPFMQVKVTSVSAGKLVLNGVDLIPTQVISMADIEAGLLTYDPTGSASSNTVTFYVQDGLDYSVSAYTLTLNKVANSQIVTFANPGTKAPSQTFVSGATSTSGLTVVLTSQTPGVCTVSALSISTVSSGTCIITASQPGDSTYAAATSVTQEFPVTSKTPQTISFTTPSTKTVGDANFTVTTSTTSGLTLTYTSNSPTVCTISSAGVVTIVGAGTCSLTAKQAGDSTYDPAVDKTVTFTVNASGGGSSTASSEVHTAGAETVTATSGVLTGYLSPNGSNLYYRFCWSTRTSTSSGALSSRVKCSSSYTASPSTDAWTKVSENITQYATSRGTSNLSAGRTIYFQVVGYKTISGGSPMYGEIFEFKTTSSSTYNQIRTDPVSSLTLDSASLNGTVKSSELTTAVYFCVSDAYTLTNSSTYKKYLSTCLSQGPNFSTALQSSISVSGSDTSTSTAIGTLKEQKTYFVQTKSVSTTGRITAYGNIVAFTTPAGPPVPTTLQVATFEGTSAVLPGSVLANGAATDITFCLSDTSTVTAGALGGCTTGTATPAQVTGTTPSSATYTASGLTVGNTYYYQVIATRGGTPYYGAVKSFTLGSPVVSTLGVSDVQESSSGGTWQAKLRGYVKTYSYNTEPSFCLSTSTLVDSVGKLSTCTAISVSSPDSTTASVSYSQITTGLTANTVYHYQAVGRNISTGTFAYGELISFTTATAPTATTDPASNIAGTSATINGSITPNGAATKGTFCVSDSNATSPDNDGELKSCLYRVSIAEGTSGELAGNAGNTTVSAVLIGLTNAKTYYFQVIADNALGTAQGAIRSFVTNSGGPIATTQAVTVVSSSSATLNGSVNSNGSNTTAWFCWGTSNAFSATASGDSMTACSRVPVSGFTVTAATTTDETQAHTLSGLSSSTDYYYQIYATNARGETTYGSILTFKLNKPIVSTSSTVSSITLTSAIIAGTANRNSNSNVHGRFCLGTSSASTAGYMDDCEQNADAETAVSISATGDIVYTYLAEELSPGTTYYYQAYTSDSTVSAPSPATAIGTIYSFKTRSLVTYEPNGATIGSTETQTATSAAALKTLAQVGYSYGSYSFSGWNTNQDGTGTSYAPGSNYSFQNNLTLYAQWTDATLYTVTYAANGGTGTVPTEADKLTDGTFVVADGTVLSKDGSTFAGWSDGTSVYAAGVTYTVGTSNVTLTAQWTSNTPTSSPGKTNPTVTWSNPAPIKFGTGLSGTQLNALFSVPGVCTYTPAAGAVLAVGTHTLTVRCVPTDGNSYNSITRTVTIEVQPAKGRPRIIWFNPSPINFPSPLSGAQLNAAASVPGTYRYSPSAGTILQPGRHSLKVRFVPTNAAENEELDAEVSILVRERPVVDPAAPPKEAEKPKAPVTTPLVEIKPTEFTKPILTTGGKTDEVVVVKENDEKTGYVVAAADWSIAISSTTKFVQGTTQDTTARVVIERGNSVTTNGTGFKPNSQVDVWVYSTPIWLGAVITDEVGNFTTTLPMPAALPEGDHTFQAQGLTPDDIARAAAVPITLVPKTTTPVAVKSFKKLKFSVFYPMDSFILTDKEKRTVKRKVQAALKSAPNRTKFKVSIVGWVQPTRVSPHIQYLSDGRANAVRKYMQALGLKGKYILNAPGHDKVNISASRRADVVITWTTVKSA